MKKTILLYVAVLFVWLCFFTVVAGNQIALNAWDYLRKSHELRKEVSHREEMFRYENSDKYHNYQLDVLYCRDDLLKAYGY